MGFLDNESDVRTADSKLVSTNGVVRATIPHSITRKFMAAMRMDAEDLMQTPVLVTYRNGKIIVTIGE